MSAIASFIRIPTAVLSGLGAAATPKKRLFGGTQNSFSEFLQKHGKEEVDYPWSGWVFNPLLVYLEQVHHIDFEHSEHDELRALITQSAGGYYLFLTHAHKQAFLAELEGVFSEEVLRDYYNEFNETSESEVGAAMLDGIRALRECLSKLDDQSVVLFHIG